MTTFDDAADGSRGRSDERSLTISCDECCMQHTDACDDCVVTFICSRSPDDAVVFDAAEARAMRAMAEVGLVPRLRHRSTG